jgi:SAM-dependent methyltransferase
MSCRLKIGCRASAIRVGLVVTCALAGAPRAAAPRSDPAPASRSVRFDEVPARVREGMGPAGQSIAEFDRFVAAVDAATVLRERDGEYDHLIHFVLQSTRFTREPRIEPAESARVLVERLGDSDRRRFLDSTGSRAWALFAVPEDVRRRTAAFIRTMQGPAQDGRIAYYKDLVARHPPETASLDDHLLAQYVRAMQFLYRKEFSVPGGGGSSDGDIAALYADRGLSTDTQIEANFGVQTALSLIRHANASRALARVLIVGPGLDVAPRTDLTDEVDPQSYQPFAVADALLTLGLADVEQLQVHCVDVSPRVVAYIRQLDRAGPTALRILTGVPERQGRRFVPEFRTYFDRVGERIGHERATAEASGADGRLSKTVIVDPRITRRISAERLNVITERYTTGGQFDLVVVTNVFPYLSPAEQMLAAANVAAALAPGGYLVTNDPRPSLASAAYRAGLEVTQARTVLLAEGPTGSVYDHVVIYRKSAAPPVGENVSVTK